MHDDAGRDPLGGLIDDVARSMTASEPPPDLRLAVRTRIARQHPPYRAPWRRAVAAACAIGVFAIAGDALLEFSGRSENVAPQVASTPVPPAVTSGGRMPPPAADRPVPVSNADRAVDRRASRPAVFAPAILSAAIAPEDLVVIAPLSDGPLDDRPVDIELMETPMPLLAEWVEIEPLSIQ